jgi:hypothetical protein
MKAALSALGLMIVAIVLSAVVDPALKVDKIVSGLIAAGLASAVGPLLFVDALTVAIYQATKHNIRFWLSSEVQRAQTMGLWPGDLPSDKVRNRAKSLITLGASIGAGIFLGLGGPLFCLICLLATLAWEPVFIIVLAILGLLPLTGLAFCLTNPPHDMEAAQPQMAVGNEPL